jgi:small subunit ribosomal protein S21
MSKFFLIVRYLYYMIIIKINNGDNIERALKTLKSKVIKTKQTQKLFEKKEYTKKSVLRRAQILKAKYIQRMKDQLN